LRQILEETHIETNIRRGK